MGFLTKILHICVLNILTPFTPIEPLFSGLSHTTPLKIYVHDPAKNIIADLGRINEIHSYLACLIKKKRGYFTTTFD